MKSGLKIAALIAVTGLAAFIVSGHTAGQPNCFRDWPAGESPQEIGTRVAENFLARQFEFEQGKREYVIYPEVCAWYGALKVADLTKNQSLEEKLIKRFDPFLATQSKNISQAAHVDYRVFGVVPLEIFLLTKGSNYLVLGKNLADKQWENPTADGITSEARYWVDDMYMISAVQVQAYRATHDRVYLDRAAAAMSIYLDKLQQTNGLFFHAPDSPFFWARGNGWYAAGMAELLSELPADHPKRVRIMEGYKTMMASLLKYQDSDGLWHQLVDRPDAWAETSGSGMFTFAIVTGVKHGWLDEKTYGPAARKAWLGLVQQLDRDANVKQVCVGTNKARQEVGEDTAAQLKFYLSRDRKTGDLHGQAPMLWIASAFLK